MSWKGEHKEKQKTMEGYRKEVFEVAEHEGKLKSKGHTGQGG